LNIQAIPLERLCSLSIHQTLLRLLSPTPSHNMSSSETSTATPTLPPTSDPTSDQIMTIVLIDTDVMTLTMTCTLDMTRVLFYTLTIRIPSKPEEPYVPLTYELIQFNITVDEYEELKGDDYDMIYGFIAFLEAVFLRIVPDPEDQTLALDFFCWFERCTVIPADLQRRILDIYENATCMLRYVEREVIRNWIADGDLLA